MKRLILLPILMLLLYSCGGSGYREVVTLQQEGTKVTILSSTGVIRTGDNRIEVRVEPPKRVKELYFYMPPMPGMSEMRDVASIEEIKKGVYRGSLKVSMDGPWQIRVVLEEATLTKDVFVPLTKASSEEASQAHGGHVSVSSEKLQLLGIITQPVERRELVKVLSAVGYVSYDLSKIHDVTLRTDAWITDTFGRFVGEYVEEGTPLMKVLSPDVQIALEELELAKGKGDQELIRKAQEKLEYLKAGEVVRSPVSGVIIERNVYEGGYLGKGKTAYRIADTSSLWIVADVPLKEAPYVRKGTPALITPEDNPESPLEGVVDYIFPEADRKANTVKVRIRLKGKRITLKPNTLVDVLFEVPIGKVLAVPETAVVDTGRRRFVFVEMSPGVYMPTEVKLGAKGEGFYEVKGGLEEGQRVVVRGTFLLDSEAQIRGVYENH